MKAIKKITLIVLMSLSIVTTACSNDKNTDTNSTGKTGSFKIDGVEYTGNTETQTFSNGSYSIICQQDNPLKLIQITFHNQAEAEAGGTFTVDDYSYATTPTGKVNIGVDGLTFDPNSVSYTINVSGNKITISSNINLTSTGAGTTTTTVNSAIINF
ncbi:MAG: hypothetical protein H6553_03315 [Chitinophagales bacterium]|nr:hypothetical protein [Chitinophagales bacterium]